MKQERMNTNQVELDFGAINKYTDPIDHSRIKKIVLTVYSNTTWILLAKPNSSDSFFNTLFTEESSPLSYSVKTKGTHDNYRFHPFIQDDYIIIASGKETAPDGQTASDLNSINNGDHRFVAGGTNEVITPQDFQRARYALQKANVPMTNLVAIVDPSVEYELATHTNLVNISNNARWEGIVRDGMSTGMKFLMNVYGFDNSWNLHNNYESVRDMTDGSRLRELPDWENAISRVKSRVPVIQTEDLQNLFTRRKALCLDSMCIGITPILLPDEVPIQHGSESYVSLSAEPITITMDIESTDYGIFQPAIYEGESEPLDIIERERVSRILVYDGAFGGLLRPEDKVEVTGTLQRVTRGNEILYQIMIGTKNGAGQQHVNTN